METLAITTTLARGDVGPLVRLAQEHLTLNGHALEIDGDFGPATRAATAAFQAASALEVTGEVDPQTFRALVAPLMRALQPRSPFEPIGALAVGYALQHLAERPREVGGDNRGPWVRTYMDGVDGSERRWCAGFVCFLIDEAARALEVPSPVRRTVSCDVLAERAMQAGTFVASPADGRDLEPGALFLVRGASPADWVHTGMVLEIASDHFVTAEGNSNSAGGNNGFAAVSRRRAFGRYDFVRVVTP